MKILNLYFKNINSLEGENRIDFQKSPLADVGVFAITGPNGSGKSSILDAISLAFYGETFRFERPAEHVITRHATESFAQVEFALGQNKYKSRWQFNRNDPHAEDEVPAVQMQLSALTENGEQLLAQSPIQVGQKMTEIIGMDFRNFCRSIMLAQGDFAAFLNALDNERMDILEKMSSRDIYTDYKQQLKNRAERTEAAVVQLKRELNALPLLDSVSFEARQHDLQDFKEQAAEFKQQQTELNQQLSWRQTINDLENQLVQLDKTRTRLSTELAEKQQTLAKISAYQPALAFQAEVEAINQLQQQLVASEKTYQDYQQELELLKQQLEALGVDKNAPLAKSEQELSEQRLALEELKYQVSQLRFQLDSELNQQRPLNVQLADRKTAQTAVSEWLTAHTAEESLLTGFPETGKLLNLRDELADLTSKEAKLVQQLEKVRQAQKKNAGEIEQTHKNIADYQQDLERSEKTYASLIETNSVEYVEALLLSQQERVDDFKELYALARVNEKVSGGGFLKSFFKKKPTEEPDEAELNRQADELAEKIARAKFLRDTLEQAVVNEALLKKMLPDRVHLVNGKPCPLCGAVQHPYAKNPPRPSNSKQALADQKQKLENLLVVANRLQQQILTNQKQAQASVKKNTDIQKNRAQWLNLAHRLAVAKPNLSIDNFSLMKELLSQEEQELKNLQILAKRYQQQQDEIAELKLLIDAEQQKLELLTAAKQQLQQEAADLPPQLQDLQQVLTQCQAEEKALAENVISQLTSLGEKMPTKGKQQDVLFERLNMRKQEYQTYVQHNKGLLAEIEQLVTEIGSKEEKIRLLQAAIEQKSAGLQTAEATSLHFAMLEKQKLMLEREQLCHSQQQQLNAQQQALQQKLLGSEYSSVGQLNDIYALISQQAGLEQESALLEQQLEQTANQQQKLQQQLEAEQVYALTEATEAQLIALQRSLNEKMAIATEEVRNLEQRLQQQQGLQEQHEALTEKLLEQEQHLQEAQLAFRLSEENGMAFRRSVQLQMATQLLTQTNKILEKISGRYYLRQAPSELGLALEIEDTYQNSSRRLPKSLSGGESFIVSLALALGLSELANNGQSVDSLFLDEGFGNLDAETLVTVVSTLQSLQTHGKTVGVISHVEGVRKRIKTRIELVKKPNGLSQLKKVS